MAEAPTLAPAPAISPPRLLIEWSSPWEEFVTAIGPALAKSPKRLAGETPAGMFPYRGMLAGWILEALLFAGVTVLPGRIALVKSPEFKPMPRPNDEVIYFSGEELPRTEDVGGAQTGKSGKAGGHETFHRTQTIRVARGSSPTEKVVDVPKLNIPKSDLPVANLLAINRTPGPPPTSGLHSTSPALPQANVVPPAPDVSRDKIQSVANSATSIIAPPPDVKRDANRAVPTFNAGIVPPSPDVVASASRTLPAASGQVVAPAPDVTRDRIQGAATLGSTNPGIVPPAPTLQSGNAGVRAAQMGTDVVPPPVSAPVSTTSSRNALTLPQAAIVAPPPSRITREGVTSGGGSQLGSMQAAVVPPPVQVQGQGGATSGSRGTGLTTSASVVPPPPSVGASGSGPGGRRSATGLGGSDSAASLAPPSSGSGGGNTKQAGVVISSQPGSRFAVPGNGGTGSMAMSPAGTSKAGVGGSGGGNGIGRGNGPGSGLEGEGSGASKTGAGHGSEVMAKGGTSPFPGPGGAGKNPSGNAPAPGISVVGGNTITLPSFGGGGGGGPDIADPTRVRGAHAGPGITVVATSRSGGAFAFYGILKGDKVYTIYIDTALGTAVLQYADPTSASKAYAQELAAPAPLRADLPANLSHPRMVIACVLDKSGVLRNLHLLQPASADVNGKVLAALASWKFRPAQRGDQPVEINAILGFNIDTR